MDLVDETTPIDEAEYKEILGKLEDAHMAEQIQKNPDWKLVLKAAKHLRDLTQEQYNHIDYSAPDAKLKAIQCQVVIQFYDNFLVSLVSRYKALGEEAYKYAQDMGWVKNMALWIKSQF